MDRSTIDHHKRRRLSAEPQPRPASSAAGAVRATANLLASLPNLPLEVFNQLNEELSRVYAIVVVKEEELDSARRNLNREQRAGRVVRARWSWLDVVGAGEGTVRTILEDLEAAKTHLDPLGIFIRPLAGEDPQKISLLRWQASIPGPAGDWAGGLYSVVLDFPEDYPANPPKCRASPPLLFPNCYPSGTLQIAGDFSRPGSLEVAQNECAAIAKLWSSSSAELSARDKAGPARVDRALQDEPAGWRIAKLLAGIQYSLAHPLVDNPAQLVAYQLIKKWPEQYSYNVRVFASLHSPSALDLVRQGQPTTLDPSVVPQGSCDWTDVVGSSRDGLNTSTDDRSGVSIVLGDIRAAKPELDRLGFLLRPWSWNGSSVDLMKWDIGIPGDKGAGEGCLWRFRIVFPENYPHDPPKLVASPPLYHPNCPPSGVWKVIRLQPGQRALPISSAWTENTTEPPAKPLRAETPRHRLVKLLLGLKSVISAPDLRVEVQPHVVQQLNEDFPAYVARVKQQAESRRPTAEDLAYSARIKARAA